MKAIIMIFTMALLFSTNSFGQKNILKFQVGYGLPLTNSLSGQNVQVNSSTTTSTGVYGTYGSGLRLEAGYIYSLNTRLSLEMDFTYLSGKPINSSFSGNGAIENQSSSAKFYEISPMLRVNLGETKIRPYAGVGPVLGLGKVTSSDITTITNNTTINAREFEQQYSGSVGIGGKGIVGAELTQGKFIFYVQLTMIAMSYSPSKSEYTKYTLNGTDQLPSLTINQKQTVYKTSVTSINNSSPDPTKPSEGLKFYIPYSNISLNAGVMFKF